MGAFELAALLMTLAAVFGLLNHHVLKFPSTIGLLVISLTASL